MYPEPTDSYRATMYAANVAGGHDYNCGQAAGGDCSCSARNRWMDALRAEYANTRGHFLTVSNALVGFAFPRTLRAFDDEVIRRLEAAEANDSYYEPEAFGSDCIRTANEMYNELEAAIATLLAQGPRH